MPTAEKVWDKYRADPDQDMHQFSPLLRELGAKCKRILEIGVRDGVSTSAFLLGLRENGGELWSIDQHADCGRVIEDSPNWHFVHGNSQDPMSIVAALSSASQSGADGETPPLQFDLLMIDGDHSEAATRADLEHYAPLVRPGGTILVHDVAPQIDITPAMIASGWHDLSGVRPAFDAFVRAEGFAHKILDGRFGLGIIQKTRVLVAVLSCQRDLSLNQALRETCYCAGAWHRFLLGSSPNPQSPIPDTYILDCEDDYEHLAHKAQAMARWALDEGYDLVFKTDADTYVDIERLLAAPLDPPVAGADYCGFYKGGPGDYAKGLGYWMSRRALEIVAELPFEYSDDVHNPGDFLAEDRWVGHWLMRHGLACVLDERYRVQEPGPEPGNDIIAAHRQNTPEKIHACHRRRKG